MLMILLTTRNIIKNSLEKNVLVCFFRIPAENLSQYLYAVQQMEKKKRCGIFISDILAKSSWRV